MAVDRADRLVAGVLVAGLLIFVGYRAWRSDPDAPGVAHAPVAATILDYKTLLRDENFHILLGNAYAEAGLVDQALAEQREALRINPKSASALNNVGFYSIQKGLYRPAIIALEQAVQLEPGMELARNNLKLAYTKAIETTPAGPERDILTMKLNALAGATAAPTAPR